MAEPQPRQAAIQNNAAFLAGSHDFQVDIERLASSDLVGTILETVMLATGMGFAAVARVTSERWVACRTVDEVNFGLREGDEIAIEQTFCQTVRDSSEMVLFSDAPNDPVYRDNPIAARFGIVSYASVPISRSDGTFFGTLCAIDTEPRDIRNPRTVAMLEMFAGLIGRSLETEERLEAQELLVEHERALLQIQEEFVAILGHDLRNPVAALEAGVRQLEREAASGRSRSVLVLMRGATRRMSEMIDNLLLHARARLGGGLGISATPDAPLSEAVRQVVEEVRLSSPEHEIELDLAFDRSVSCDAPRIAQAVSNLLSNAMTHGDPEAPIAVRGQCSANDVTISVTNRGGGIPDDLRRDLFHPFRRGTDAGGGGLGLGLYIASSIARAHNGRITLTSDDQSTTFTLILPLLSRSS